ncbi:plasmid partitioning protein RepB C-terminal domain-containing protein [Paraburkholderia graminis]|uniref:plasmid partitioning protein RepB C-terminal domain-containing protein n=1 Tax=Paraburkholderia graminis TaxID=60548 RepID=UPI00286B2978|nr:plasmid partitioning protein RepB C-terminal domain-containing protein [Paraburkholderia graminis]
MRKARSPRFICRTVSSGNRVPGNLCPEAAAMVAEQTLPARTAQALEKMSPARQVEAVSMMVRQDNLTGDFARALLAATPASMRVDAAHGHVSHPDCVRRLGGIVQRLTALQQDAQCLRSRHDGNLLLLTLAAGWARGWVRDAVIAQWLQARRPDYAAVLEGLVQDADYAIVPGRRMKLAYEVAGGTVAVAHRSKRRKRRCL